jgi:hypothetical protein
MHRMGRYGAAEEEADMMRHDGMKVRGGPGE